MVLALRTLFLLLDLVVLLGQFRQLLPQLIIVRTLLVILLDCILQLLLEKKSFLNLKITGETNVFKLLQARSQLLTDILSGRPILELVESSVRKLVEKGRGPGGRRMLFHNFLPSLHLSNYRSYTHSIRTGAT